MGDGKISATNGALLDADFYFDAAHVTQTTVAFGSGGTLSVTADGQDLGAGYRSNGSLTISSGVAITSFIGYLGFYAGSSGAATVTGIGSRWTMSNDLFVGREGLGTLTVANGGQVTAQTLYASLGNLMGNGKITATKGALLDADFRFDAAHPTQVTMAFGSGGTLSVTAGEGVLGAGYKTNGSLTITEGVAVTSYDGYLGYYAGSLGTATISGAGSTWILKNSGPYVGYYGNGELRIEAGGQVTSPYITNLGMWSNSSGTATINGIGSKWINNQHLIVGYYGKGTLHIEAGGQVSDTFSILGYVPGSSGTVSVSGADSTWTNTTGIYIGNYGKGMLLIESGGKVTNSGSSVIGDLSGSSGSAMVTGTSSRWTTSGSLTIGKSANGTLHIKEGGEVANAAGYLGYHAGSSGTVTITGADSKWTNSGDLYVGRDGAGALTVADGGEVTTQTLYASLKNLYGDGKITATSGAIVDADFCFDAAHPTHATVAFGSGGTLSIAAGGGVLGAGYKENGSLTVIDGKVVTSSIGYLGYNSGSCGTATISGTGSKWNNSGNLSVGYNGNGTLRIEAGGEVTDAIGYLGNRPGSSYTATITGIGSKWTNNSALNIGFAGSGTLHLRDGGVVTATSITIRSNSLLTCDAGYGSNLRAGSSGTGTITNNGKIRLLAGPALVTGSQFSPISAGTWSGSGTYQALGGTWNTSNHVFTVSQTLSKSRKITSKYAAHAVCGNAVNWRMTAAKSGSYFSVDP